MLCFVCKRRKDQNADTHYDSRMRVIVSVGCGMTTKTEIYGQICVQMYLVSYPCGHELKHQSGAP